MKVNRICTELNYLKDYGVFIVPKTISNALSEDVEGLTISDKSEVSSADDTQIGGLEANLDPSKCRNGERPKEEMREALECTIKEAIAKVSSENIL